MGPSYLKEIKHPPIVELIDERFYGISSLMTEHAVMYGGTINSILAGFEVKGDLDIAASEGEFMVLAQNIASSAMWVQTDGEGIPERNSGRRWGVDEAVARIKMKDYSGAGALPLNRIAQFETVNGAKVHVLQAKLRTGDFLEDALSIVRAVDLKCCGVALDKYGRLLEAVEGGYSDCEKRIITINRYDPQKDADATRARIKKYLDRGWQLETPLETIMENFRKAQEKYLRQQAARAHHRKRKGEFPNGIVVGRSKSGRCEIKLFKSVLDKTGIDRFLNIIRKEAKLRYSCQLTVIGMMATHNMVIVQPEEPYHLTLQQAKDVMHRSIARLEQNYDITLRTSNKRPAGYPYKKAGKPKAYSNSKPPKPATKEFAGYTTATFDEALMTEAEVIGDSQEPEETNQDAPNFKWITGHVDVAGQVPPNGPVEEDEEMTPDGPEVPADGPVVEVVGTTEEEDFNDLFSEDEEENEND